MEQLIRNLTVSLTEKLQGQKEFFTPDDLRTYDIPEFLVRRVEAEMYRNLNESVVPPHSEWANMEAPDVEEAWEQFIQAILAEVRMPGSYLQPVFETAVSDVLELILKPRTSVHGILFGPDDKLSATVLQKRLAFITVNQHLADSILRYMDRKGKDEISREIAHNVVQKVDERLTAGYNSLNWAQLLQPLFILLGPEVDTELFRIFFKQRGMKRFSRRFDLMTGSLTKTGFIETLSSPDLLNEEGYDDEQTSLFSSGMEQSRSDNEMKDFSEPQQAGPSENKPNAGQSPVEKDKTEDQNQPEDEQVEKKREAVSEHTLQNKDDYPEPEEETLEVNASDKKLIDEVPDKQDDADEYDDTEAEDSILGTFQRNRRGVEDDSYAHDLEEHVTGADDEPDEGDHNHEDQPLYSRFDAGQSDVEEVGEETASEEETVADQFRSDDFGAEYGIDEINDETEDEYKRSDPTEDVPEEESEPAEDDSFNFQEEDPDTVLVNFEDEGEESDTPIWQAFLGDEEAIEDESIPDTEYEFPVIEEETTVDDEPGFDEEPTVDLTAQNDESEIPKKLLTWLQGDEDRFTRHIFSGSETAYEQALTELNAMDSWKQASRYIEKEIFARNLVDMYDEEAVDFTDRLQEYFDQFKS